MDSGKRRVIEHTPAADQGGYKKPKWSSNFTQISKLDEMLMNYKTIPDNDPIPIPITDDFYRDTKKSNQDKEGLKGDKKEIKSA